MNLYFKKISDLTVCILVHSLGHDDKDYSENMNRKAKLFTKMLRSRVFSNPNLLISEKAKIIQENINKQTLFVRHPDYECYSTTMNEYMPTDSQGSSVFNYHPTPNRSCEICAKDYEQGDVLMKLTGCGHIFHADCIIWHMYYSEVCTLCMRKIYYP